MDSLLREANTKDELKEIDFIRMKDFFCNDKTPLEQKSARLDYFQLT